MTEGVSGVPTVLRELTEVDDRARSLTARRQALPDTEQVTALTADVDRRRSELAGLRRRSDDLDSTVRRLRQDASRLRERRREDIDGLRSVTDIERRRDLRHDLTVAERRLGEVEEAMEREERLLAAFISTDGEPDKVTAAVVALETAVAERDRARDVEKAVLADIDRQLEDLAAASSALRDRLPQDVRARYEEAERSTGAGAALLAGNLCRSCFMSLDPQSLARIIAAPQDQLVTCPECDCLLIREDS